MDIYSIWYWKSGVEKVTLPQLLFECLIPLGSSPGGELECLVGERDPCNVEERLPIYTFRGE